MSPAWQVALGVGFEHGVSFTVSVFAPKCESHLYPGLPELACSTRCLSPFECDSHAIGKCLESTVGVAGHVT